MQQSYKRMFVAAMAAGLSLAFIAAPTMAKTVSQDGADAHFASEEWAEAIQDYEALLYVDDENAENWFNLGSAYQSLEKPMKAAEAYEKALAANYQPAVRAHYRLAIVNMMMDKKDKALNHLEALGEAGGYNFRAVRETAEFEPLKKHPRFTAVIDALRPCQGEGYRDFDFWLGHWDVTAAGNTDPTASNKISATQDGCVILEEYTAGYFTGTSLSFYDSAQEKWHQTWMSNAGGALYLEGGLNAAGSMVMTDQYLPISKVNETINRVTWTPIENGTVRQHWENSTDGETWADVFDGTYKLKPNDNP